MCLNKINDDDQAIAIIYFDQAFIYKTLNSLFEISEICISEICSSITSALRRYYNQRRSLI